jgi:hypothetical protein
VSGQQSSRVDALHARTCAAIDELRGLRCPDAAAGDALDAVRLAVHTLEHWWLPELARRRAVKAGINDF